MPGIVQLSVRPPMAVFGSMAGVPVVMRRMVGFAVSMLLLQLVLPLLRAVTIPTLL